MSDMTPPSWWPPKVGDKLRHATLHKDGKTGGVKKVEALLHVLAVVDHVGDTLLMTAEWFPSRRRWNYQVFDLFHASCGTIWPDGQPNPRA